jgi:zinc transporter ZupT
MCSLLVDERRAIDALIILKNGQLAPRIGWVQTIVGFLLMVIGIAGFIGILIGVLFFITHEEKENIPNFMRFSAGCGLWAMLGSLSVIARFRQRRLLKKQKLPAAIETSSLKPA